VSRVPRESYPSIKRLFSSGRCVDSKDHAHVAVISLVAEEPLWSGVVFNLYRVHGHLGRVGSDGHKARVDTFELGGGIELLCARLAEGGLGDGVIFFRGIRIRRGHLSALVFDWE